MDKKTNPTDIYQVNPHTPNRNVEQTLHGFLCVQDLFFVHRAQARSPKTTLKFGGVWFHRPSTVCILLNTYLFTHLYNKKYNYIHIIIEGGLEVKLPTMWADGKAKWKSRGEEKRRKSQKKEDAGARKGSKVAKHCVFFSNVLGLRRVEK